MRYIHEDERIIIAYCERCKRREYVRKYEGRTDPKYRKIFKRDILQPGTNLYYKEYGHMNIL